MDYLAQCCCSVNPVFNNNAKRALASFTLQSTSVTTGLRYDNYIYTLIIIHEYEKLGPI